MALMPLRPLLAAFSLTAASAAALVGAPSGSGATNDSPVTITDLGTLGEPASAAVDLNNRDTVVGNAFDPASGRSNPVAWLHGEDRVLGYGAYRAGRMLQVNDQNTAIGTLDSELGVTHGVYWDHHGRPNVLHADAEFSSALDLNDNDEVLLWYSLPDESPGGATEHASIWYDGHEVPVLPAPSGEGGIDPDLRLRPVALNDSREVAITAEDRNGDPVSAYHWSDGHFTDLGSLGGGGTEAAAIDNYGRIAGTSRDEAGRERAFVWENGEMRDLGTLGGETSRVAARPTAMSDAGHVLGTSSDTEGRQRAFVWNDGELRELGTLGGDEPEPVAVNAMGEIAGYDYTQAGEHHAFFWDGETMLDLGTLGGEMSRAYALNDRGQVVGVSLTDTGAHHAVQWTIAR